MSLCSYRPANPRRIRTDSKHSLRLLICLFSSSLAYSILASVISAPTANEVCGLYPFSPERETCCMISFSATFGFLPLYKNIGKSRLSIFPGKSRFHYPCADGLKQICQSFLPLTSCLYSHTFLFPVSYAKNRRKRIFSFNALPAFFLR